MTKILVLLLLWSSSLLADSLNVRVEPKEPLANENFKIVFEIDTEEGTDPVVNFDPLNLDVISKSETGVRTRTTYINGRLSTERTLSVAYEVTAQRPGSAFVRNIEVELNGKKLRHKTLRINILKTPRKARNVIVRAEVDRNEAFVGESVLVRYYLYNKTPVLSTDIKRFPKLENFLKRYHQEKAQAERVELNGEIYTRRVIYTAQLFPSKPGTYNIDPITLGVRYSNKGSSPFDTFGLGSRYGSRNMTLSSPPVKLEVKALPAHDVPPSFTGLVGHHDFKLEINKNKFVVNEPIELKLTVVGKGALELYEAPKIFTDAGIEAFESTADLALKEDFTATKTFLYTYLGREGLEIKNKRIPFTYFDPEKLEFKTEYVNLGDLIVAGSAKAPVAGQGENPATRPGAPLENERLPKTFFEPVYKLAGTYSYNAFYIALGLGAAFVMFVFWISRKKLAALGKSKPKAIVTAAKRGVDYSCLRTLIMMLGEGDDMRQVIKQSRLSEQGKRFFLELAEKCEAQYAKGSKGTFYRLPKKRLKELANAIGNSK